jgi:fibronectin-binding autotransporter adhesin
MKQKQLSNRLAFLCQQMFRSTRQIPNTTNLDTQMKTNIRTQALFLNAIILGTILSAVAPAPAANILQTASESSPSDWNAAIWGSPTAVPVSGSNYETPSGLQVRTANSTTSDPFIGSSLQIDSGGILYLKHNNAVQTVNLVLTGGEIVYHGAPGGTNTPIGGTLQVISNSTVGSDQLASTRDIWLESAISGSGNLTVSMLTLTNACVLSGTNTSYSGNWTVVSNTINGNTGPGGYLTIWSGASNALGSGTVTLNDSGTTALVFNATNSFVISNTISGAGYIIKLNTNTITLSGNNAFTGSVRITNGVLQIGAGSSLSNSSTIFLAGGTLDASLIGGFTLNASTFQTMTNCNGTVISNLTVSASNALNFNISATTNDTLNVTGLLTLNGNPNLSITQNGFVPSGTYTLINYSGGSIQGGGSFTLVPPAGSTETFALNYTSGKVTLTVTAPTYNLTWVGDNANNYWDTTSPNWSGATNLFVTGDNVTFNDSGSANPAINIDSAIVYPNSVTINNTANYYTFTGYGISTSGSLTKMGSNEVDFVTAGNAFSGPINIQAGILSIGNGQTTGSLGTGSISNNGVLQVNLSSGGAAFNSPISGSGSLNITGNGAAVTIGGTNTYAGTTTIGSGCQLNISTSSALGVGSNVVTVLSGGRLGVASYVGLMTVPNPVVINGTGIGGAPGALYVNSTGNIVTWGGPITVASDAQVRAVNIDVTNNFSNTVLGTNVSLECTSGNTQGDSSTVMTFENTVSLGSGGSLLADGFAVVVLAGGTNVWGGGTAASIGTLLVNGTLNGGALAVGGLGTLGGSGTILDPVTVDGILAPGPIAGIGTLTVSNSVTLDSDGTTVMDINRANAPTASLLSATSVSYGGTLTVNNIGSTNLQAGDTFTLFAGSISGTFGTINLPALPSTNLYWTNLLSSGIIQVASSVAVPPTITSPSVSGTNFTLQVASSQNGYNYVAQSTSSLSPASWTSVETNAGNGGMLTFTIPITPGHPQMFYRIIIP